MAWGINLFSRMVVEIKSASSPGSMIRVLRVVSSVMR